LFYAIVLRNCFTQLFYAFLRMSVKEKFTQKSCFLRKGQLVDVSRLWTVGLGPRLPGRRIATGGPSDIVVIWAG